MPTGSLEHRYVDREIRSSREPVFEAQTLQLGQAIVNILAHEETQPIGFPSAGQRSERVQEISMAFIGM